MYLLDTNVISEMRKASPLKATSAKMDERVANWVGGVSGLDMFLSVVSILELERGFHLLRRRSPEQADTIRLWIRNRLLPAFEGRIFQVDLAIMQRCASLALSQTMEYRESLLAATALVHGMTLVTKNVRHFEATGVDLINPWNG
jgi:hypothetical protein